MIETAKRARRTTAVTLPALAPMGIEDWLGGGEGEGDCEVGMASDAGLVREAVVIIPLLAWFNVEVGT